MPTPRRWSPGPAVPLLAREARGVRILATGEAVLHHACLVLHPAERLRIDPLAYGDGLRGHVRVFATATVITDGMPRVLASWLAVNPRLSVDLREKPNLEIAGNVVEGRADIGIVAGRIDILGSAVIPFSTDQLAPAVPLGHGFARLHLANAGLVPRADDWRLCPNGLYRFGG